MLHFYFVFFMSSDVKLASINYFVPSVACLSYIDPRAALLAENGIDQLEKQHVKTYFNLGTKLLGLVMVLLIQKKNSTKRCCW